MPSLEKTAIDADHRIRPESPDDSSFLERLPIGMYACDADGRIVRYNRAAARLWGREPGLGAAGDRFCGSQRFFDLNGNFIAHAECPMAVALTTGQDCTDQLITIERPDGSRLTALINIEVLKDEAGSITGAVNVFRANPIQPPQECQPHEADSLAMERLAAIVQFSDDAILSKDLNGIIRSWNRGAERLFGYAGKEIIGKPVTILIPPDRLNEEPEILSRIRRGERIEHYETVRQRKDGSLVDISLSVSPVADSTGKVVGASKIARDISERRRAEGQKDLVLKEMNHRIKNLFALASGMVNLSARGTTEVGDLVADLQAKFQALARAHSLTLSPDVPGDSHQVATLHDLITEVTRPYRESEASPSRIVVTGPDLPLGRAAVSNLALLLHEFATNALKYGALAVPSGQVGIACSLQGGSVCIEWTESGAQPDAHGALHEGFGSRLARATIGGLGGKFSRQFIEDGLSIRVTVPRARLEQ